MKTALLSLLIFIITTACREEFYPLTPPKDPSFPLVPTSSCQTPSIEKNIIGSWRYASTYNLYAATHPDTTTYGTITFDAQGKINDPDSLFENHLNGFPATDKSYKPQVRSDFSFYTGMLFVVNVTAKQGTQINYFTVISNECNRIHMTQLRSANNGIGFILTR